MNPKTYDFAIVGGGLIGLATAHALLKQNPGASLLILEKEDRVAAHQSGRNSGVLHSGIYYKPGSLKAQMTSEGRTAMLEFCREHAIPFEICGKVIVATDVNEVPRLDPLYTRGLENGLKVSRVSRQELSSIEPHVSAVEGIWIPEAGIVDFPKVASTLADTLMHQGVEVRLRTRLIKSKSKTASVMLTTSRGQVEAKIAINCGGLFSDRLARQTGVDPGLRIVPFRGENFMLTPEAKGFVRGLIYPLADPRFPFLGVHLTKMTDGNVLAGPNAVFSLSREGYHGADFDLRDTLESFSYSGFWRLVMPNLGTGLGEMLRAWNVHAFARALQKLVPAIKVEHLVPARAGVRAQAVDRAGKLVEDFRFAQGDRWLHVLNAPSPAATACFAIGRYIAKQVSQVGVEDGD